MKNINLKILLVSILFSNCNKEIVPSSYSVKYEVKGTVINAIIVYNDIPDKGKVANEKYTRNTCDRCPTDLPWSASLSGSGYHNAPYKISVQGGSTGWLYVNIYQDGTLVRTDSTQGTNPVIESVGLLPK